MSQLERVEDLYKAYVRCRPIPEVELVVQGEQTNERQTQRSD